MRTSLVLGLMLVVVVVVSVPTLAFATDSSYWYNILNVVDLIHEYGG
jgi:hypothetical protein